VVTVRICSLVLIVGGVFLSRSVHAKPEFPGVVANEFDVCAPPCSLCHTGGTPSEDNVLTPFGLNVNKTFSEFTIPKTEENLRVVLASIETECENDDDIACQTTPCGPCNADGTGAPDIAELRKDQNPNNSGMLACPEYGCGARVAPARESRSLDGAFALAVVGAAEALRRGFRRVARRSPH
jgi:MYXO-CTERM domain-containing protein